jgi:hypothetical protein
MRSPQGTRRHLRAVSEGDRSGTASAAGGQDAGTPTDVGPRAVLKMRVDLAGMEVPVWRELLVPARLTLEEVHVIVQVCFDWEDAHLHEFQVGHERFLDARDDTLLDMPHQRSDGQVRLHQLVDALPFEFHYLYSQDEFWSHRVRVTEMLAPSDVHLYPLCVGGQNAAPPEGVGGAHGYNDFLRCLARASTPDGIDALQWIGGFWDPGSFSTNVVNRTLHGDRRLLMMSNSRDRLERYWDPE